MLFVVTLCSTTLAGAEWMFANNFFFSYSPMGWGELLAGLHFSLPFLAILTAHEFGHYFTARYYDLKVTLPYYIPVWFGGLAPSIGTMGAFIKIKSPLHSRKEFFDVGVAGPLAGFVVSLLVLWYGFANLPEPEYIFKIHPEYAVYGLDYAQYVYEDLPEGSIKMGTNLLFEFFKAFVVDDPRKIPNPHEMFHYPYLLAGFLACFFTALNLIPIGQLDGGHILYGLVGYRRHQWLSPIFFLIFMFFGGLGLFSFQDFLTDPVYNLQMTGVYLVFLYFVFEKVLPQKKQVILLCLVLFAVQFVVKSVFTGVEGYNGWLLFGLILGRFLGVYHPPAIFDGPLDARRKAIGWLSLLIFLISFSPSPFILQ